MGQKRFYNRLSGINPLAYVGVEPYSPPDLVVDTRSPTSNDSAGFHEGALWLVDTNPNFEVWMLASLNGNIATWIQLFPSSGGSGANIFPTDIAGPAVQAGGVLNIFGESNITQTQGAGNTVTIRLVNGTNGQVIIGGGVQPMWANITSLGGTVSITNGPNSINLEAMTAGTVVNLQGNAGPAVPPNGAGTINVIGNTAVGLSTTSVGQPPNTLLITTTSGNVLLESLTGNVGGPVFPSATNNINVIGAGAITVTGNPGTNTLTITTSAVVATSFPTDAGTAIPVAGVLNVLGGINISTTGVGNTITINSDTGSIAFLAEQTAPVPNVTGDNTVYTMVYNHEFYDLGANYNPGNGHFTAPVTGKYHFSAQVYASTLSAAHTSSFIAIVNPTGPATGPNGPIVNPFGSRSIGNLCYGYVATTDLPMDAGDDAFILFDVAGGAKTVSSGATGSAGGITNPYFGGHIITTL